MFRSVIDRLTGRKAAAVKAGKAGEAVKIPGDGLQVVYSPDLDGQPDPGEVVWAWIPYEDDPSQGKDRPAVVIGLDGADLVLVPLTTKRHPGRDDEVEVGSGGWDRSQRSSYAKIDDVLRVAPAGVRREGAILDRARFDRLVAAVQAYERSHPPR